MTGGGSNQEDKLILEMREELVRLARPEDLKVSLHRQGGLGEQMKLQVLIVAVVKFEDREKAEGAFALWSSYPNWSVSWITTDNMTSHSNIRASGLVQLVPHEPPGPLILRPGKQEDFGVQFPVHQTISDTKQLYPQAIRTFEEASYALLSLASNSHDGNQSLKPYTLFVGRLNSQQVTLELIKERFSPYGCIAYIRLFMRGMFGLDGVPLDSYAFIIYQHSIKDDCTARSAAVEAAINDQVNSNPFSFINISNSMEPFGLGKRSNVSRPFTFLLKLFLI